MIYEQGSRMKIVENILGHIFHVSKDVRMSTVQGCGYLIHFGDEYFSVRCV